MSDNLEGAGKTIKSCKSLISGGDFPVSNLIKDSPTSINTEVIPQKFCACRYENDWYFGIANYVPTLM